MPAIPLLSPGTTISETDISSTTTRTPTGIPGCVISATSKGPAFVPLMTTNLSDYVSVFGGLDANTPLGYLCAREWFSNTSVPLLQLRVLGAGDATQRTANGSVTSAGFVVGSQEPVLSTGGGLGANPFANATGVTGSVYVLGCFMSESTESTIFSDAGLQTSGQNIAAPIVRGILFAPSGVVLRLSSAGAPSSPPLAATIASETTYFGSFTGSVDLSGGKQDFKLYLNGHKGTDLRYPNVYSLSFDPTSSGSFFPNVLNTDPLKLQEAGHLLYSSFNMYSAFAAPTGSGIIDAASGSAYGTGIQNIAFLLPSSGSGAKHTSNLNSAITPNMEGFSDRYGHAFSPWVISQGFGGNPVELFKLHHLSDGEVSNNDVKISILNIKPSTDTQPYGSFDLLVRPMTDRDEVGALRAIETFTNLSLDPTSPNYIARRIGTINTFYNFDTDAASQKITTTGDYPNSSKYVRVEVSDMVDSGDLDASAVPFGFRGPQHLVTGGSSSLFNVKQGDLLAPAIPYFDSARGLVPLFSASQPPLPMRLHLKKATPSGVDQNLFWGIHFQSEVNVNDPNASTLFNDSILSYNKFYPGFEDTANAQFSVFNNAGIGFSTSSGILDSDKFNNNLFSLEKIKIVTGSGNVPNTSPSALLSWQYVRKGAIAADDATKTRALTVSDLNGRSNVQALAKFSFYLERGFDGVDIFNADARYLKNAAVSQEITQPSRGLTNGPTLTGYTKALHTVSDVNDVGMQLLVVPSIRVRYVTDTAINMVEQDRFDCFYIMDPEQYDTNGTDLTGSYSELSVAQTAEKFIDRGVNSSFAATYFPDVSLRVAGGTVYTNVPSSVVAFGVYARNDAIAAPFYAPAGVSRGVLTNVDRFSITLDQTNADRLYVARINPLISKLPVGPVVWGQKTLLNKESLLNRVNVRRLLIAIRREVRAIGVRFLFEPARASTLQAFNAAVQPVMARYQSAGGVEAYKVAIDSTTTSQADLDNKTIRGQIFLIPATSLEFVSIDFVVTNRNSF
jgi:phage tail sheath protein FI